MKNIQNLSIKLKLTLIIITVSLVAIIIGFSILTYLNISNLKKDLLNQSTLIARLTVENLEFALVFEDTKVAKENLSSLKTIPNIIKAEIYDANGNLFVSFKNKEATFRKLIVKKSKSTNENGNLQVFEPFKSSNGEIIGCLFLEVSQNELNKNVQNYIFWLIVVILFVLIIIVVLAGNFQKIISKPIYKLVNIIEQISESHDYSLRIDKKSNDEIGTLYEGFNQMLEEIAKYEKSIIKAKDELFESQELFSTFMEMLPAVAYIKNADSTFSYVNKFLTERFNAELWISDDLKNTIVPEEKKLNTTNDKESLTTVQHYEESIYNLKNEMRYFESWKFPILRKDKPTLIGGISIDITDRKMAEKQVSFYVKELERNNQELEEFNYVASHDLREPLRTITSYCELLSDDLGISINEDVREDIKFITDATTRMNNLIQDLLQLSRAGRVEFESKTVDLEKVFNIVLQDLELKIKESHSLIKIDKMPFVIGDPVQLGRVFQNLITNAIKFKADKNPEIHLYAKENGNTISITVADNGIGIDLQYHQQIFAAFKRLHSRDKYEGTGIGLAICKKIVERHGGKISIESETGKGSKFIVQLRKAG